ncbi:MAG TPA: Flp pilus assembly protein CpaB [Patescibacteria group bacterium]|nr:Flp pilus assembly protein CpaB [Patescibacteria group bacterium]
MSRTALRVLALVLFAAMAALFVRSVVSSGNQPAAEAAPPPTRVRAAAIELPTGTLIQPGDLQWIEIPGHPSDDVFAQGRDPDDKLTGAVVRLPLTKGAAIERSRIVLPDAPGFLSAALAPGKRAISVAINDVSGNAGLILPGDFVDVILSQHLNGNSDGGATRNVIGETVLTNVRVIAVGRQFTLAPVDAKAGGANTARTVTFEVDSEQAEVVVVAGQLGELTLALRSLASENGNIRETDSQGGAHVVPVSAENLERPKAVRAEDVSTANMPPRAAPNAPEAAQAYIPPAATVVKIYRGSAQPN